MSDKTDRELLQYYREAFEVMAYVGLFKDAEELKQKIEAGDFQLDYEVVKAAAINASYEKPALSECKNE